MMQESSKKIEMTCPICKIKKEVEIPMSVFSQKKTGSIKINIPKGAICSEHTFLAYLDPDGRILGLEKIDLEMRDNKNEKKRESPKLTIKRLLEEYSFDGLLNMLHAKIFNYRCYIIKDFKDMEACRELNDFFNNILPEEFRNLSIDFIIKGEYERLLKKYQNALYIDPHTKEITIPWEEKIKYEKNIVEKALDIINEGEQLILFQREIHRLFEEANFVVKIVDRYGEISERRVINELKKNFLKPKIKNNYFKLLLKLINQRDGIYPISKIKGKIAKSFFKKNS